MLKRSRLRIAITAIALLLAASSGFAAELRGRVVAIADGDTVTILDAAQQQHRIRLNGIDAPETGQAFSQVAKSNLSSLVFGQDVLVVWAKVDRYGRLVGTVTIGSVNANFEQLKAGLAWYYRDYAGDVAAENRPLYEAAEAEARTAKRGLWRDVAPIAPWVYRGERAPATAVGAPAPSAPTRSLGLFGTVASSVEGSRQSKLEDLPRSRLPQLRRHRDAQSGDLQDGGGGGGGGLSQGEELWVNAWRPRTDV